MVMHARTAVSETRAAVHMHDDATGMHLPRVRPARVCAPVHISFDHLIMWRGDAKIDGRVVLIDLLHPPLCELLG